MRRPRVVAIKRVMIRMIGRRGVHTVTRYYLTLDFGGVRKLATTARVVRWLHSR